MEQKQIRSQTLSEGYTKIEHPSGLTMLLYPMEGFFRRPRAVRHPVRLYRRLL